MTTLANWRNGAGTQLANLATSPDGTFQAGALIRLDWGVTVFHRDPSDGTIIRTSDLSSFPALVTYGITPIVSDALGGDDHNAISVGIDDQNRTWVCGNSRGTLQAHLIVSPANSLASWTTFTPPFPGWSGTSPWGNYAHFRNMADGRLLWFFNRRDSSAHDQGLEIHAFVLPLGGGTTWDPLVGTGTFINTDFGSIPERIYFQGAFVEPVGYPHPDRVWIAGVWRDNWNDGATQHDPFVLYSDDVTDETSWKRIDGTSQTMPVTYANIIGTSGTVPTFGVSYWFPSWQLVVDPQGHPHLMNYSAIAVDDIHVWWDGANWQSESVGAAAAGYRPQPFLTPSGDILIYYRRFGRITIARVNGNKICDFGDPISASWEASFGDPTRLQDGVLEMLIPDGDTPKVATFGNHHRCIAS